MLSPLRKRAGRRLREPFGKAGLTVAVIALVFAMLGGAYAASGLNSKQKKEVKAIAKSFQGTGPAGAQGPAGPAGPAGAKGDSGAPGAKGDTGSAGNAGAAGKSAEAIPFSGARGPIGGVTCSEGGLEVKSASPATLVCNGKKGEKGEKGEDGEGGTGGGTELPAGESLYGHWGYATTGGLAASPISFNLHYPDEAGPEFNFVTFEEVENEEAPEGCPGNVDAPAAEPGHLCVYEIKIKDFPPGHFEELITLESETYGVDSYGVTLFFSAGEFGASTGSWAVTAPEAP
jgi:hypothetical protein